MGSHTRIRACEQHMKRLGYDLGEHAIWCKAAFAIAAKNKAETIRAADGMGDDCTQYVLEELDAAKRYFDGLTTIRSGSPPIVDLTAALEGGQGVRKRVGSPMHKPASRRASLISDGQSLQQSPNVGGRRSSRSPNASQFV